MKIKIIPLTLAISLILSSSVNSDTYSYAASLGSAYLESEEMSDSDILDEVSDYAENNRDYTISEFNLKILDQSFVDSLTENEVYPYYYSDKESVYAFRNSLIKKLQDSSWTNSVSDEELYNLYEWSREDFNQALDLASDLVYEETESVKINFLPNTTKQTPFAYNNWSVYDGMIKGTIARPDGQYVNALDALYGISSSCTPSHSGYWACAGFGSYVINNLYNLKIGTSSSTGVLESYIKASSNFEQIYTTDFNGNVVYDLGKSEPDGVYTENWKDIFAYVAKPGDVLIFYGSNGKGGYITVHTAIMADNTVHDISVKYYKPKTVTYKKKQYLYGTWNYLKTVDFSDYSFYNARNTSVNTCETPVGDYIEQTSERRPLYVHIYRPVSLNTSYSPEISTYPIKVNTVCQDPIDNIYNSGISCEMLTTGGNGDLEYRWFKKREGEDWSAITDWDSSCKLEWTPDIYGTYIITGMAREKDNPSTMKYRSIAYTYCPILKAECQIPDPEGEGFLIGMETYENHNYLYELLIYDINKGLWVWSTGKLSAAETSVWAKWQPEYGVFWTLFRIYDSEENLVDQRCFSFVHTDSESYPVYHDKQEDVDPGIGNE